MAYWIKDFSGNFVNLDMMYTLYLEPYISEEALKKGLTPLTGVYASNCHTKVMLGLFEKRGEAISYMEGVTDAWDEYVKGFRPQGCK